MKLELWYSDMVRFMTDASEYGDYYQQFIEDVACPRCKGRRLSDTVLSVTVGGLNIDEFCSLPISRALEFVDSLEFSESKAKIAGEVIKEIKARLNKAGSMIFPAKLVMIAQGNVIRMVILERSAKSSCLKKPILFRK